MYCTSLEPKRGLGQGADFSVLAAINYAIPHAKSLHDIGVRAMSAADVTRAMLADLNSLKGGSVNQSLCSINATIFVKIVSFSAQIYKSLCGG